MKLEGKVARVTGAGSGIGRAIALALVAEGAMVALNDIRVEAAEAVAAEVSAAGGRALPLQCDVADGRATLKMFTRVLTTWDTLDILVNNAGAVFIAPHVVSACEALAGEVAAGGAPTSPLDATATMEDGAWRRTIAVHLDGTFHCTREALKVMQTRRAGKIINMASVAGTTGLAGAPDYSAAKGGIIAFTKSVAKEVAHLNIQVNAIAPGFIDTPLLEALSPTMRATVLAQTPLGRLGTVDEIAAAARYLASPEADFLTGQVLSPNGGYAI
ncbi:MAG: SDR family oxidoreductase [Deltaproteobacteria bacterium]|nr:SDR family oxidoreductase [Deltaproteobacteria bacterium]